VEPKVNRSARKILIVEDDDAMATALRDGFTFEGFEVAVAKDGARGLQLAVESPPDLVILDVMLPKLSGLDVCKRIRASRSDLPVIMLTARGQEIDKVLGLKAGADDYVTKPFSFMELLARVEAVLRRSRGAGPVSAACRFGDVEVDFVKCEACKGGKPIEMSALELRLLQFFVEHRGEAVSRDQLLTAVWGYESSLSRTVDVHVAKLRRKIEDRPEAPRFLVTVHGLGYKFTG
jgi:two-component system alkaline phosphatase synthesis response regulator PhoP